MKTFVKYPAMRYHNTLAPEGRVISSPEAEAALGDGWVDTPAAFDPAYKALTTDPPEGTAMDTVVLPAKPPERYPAMRYARDGRTQVVRNAEEEVSLDPVEWKDTPDPHAWAGMPPIEASSTPDAALTIGESLYLLNAAESQRLVSVADSPEKLDAIEIAERAHPKHEGGRVSVLRAIAETREALAVGPTR